jgi:hypothetical protein|tara:strand:+ start:5975 stop:6247 length:273 start_codon:yes stop_codon:yes gene_type:complete
MSAGALMGAMGGAGGMTGMGSIPSFTGGSASSSSESSSGSIYSGAVDQGGFDNSFNFGGSGAGVNTGAGTISPMLLIGGVILLGVLWLRK